MHSDQALELADALEIHGAQTLDFFRELTPAQFAIQVYPDGAAWTVHNLLAHFVEVEGSIRTLIERVAQGGEGVAEDFSIDRWNARYTAEMSQHDDAYLLAEFARRRAATVAMARGLAAADLEKRGRHPFLGVTEIKHMLKLMYVHLLGHQRDIRKALNEAQSVD